MAEHSHQSVNNVPGDDDMILQVLLSDFRTVEINKKKWAQNKSYESRSSPTRIGFNLLHKAA